MLPSSEERGQDKYKLIVPRRLNDPSLSTFLPNAQHFQTFTVISKLLSLPSLIQQQITKKT
jgi:hypothetical protein